MSDIKNIILNSPEGACLNNQIHLLNTIDYIAERIKEVPGDIVECGVWKGAMLSYMATVFTNRTIFNVCSYEAKSMHENLPLARATMENRYNFILTCANETTLI